MSSDAAEEKCLSAVAVYCSARDLKNSIYGQRVTELGALLASRKISVVFGGSTFGLLGKLAESVTSNGGKITGVIPEFFTKYAHYVPSGNNEIVVPDMHTRKKLMFDSVEAFIALPGGIGTMEELMEVLTWANLDLHSKPIALLNVNGYYDHFIQWLSHSIKEGFVRTVSCVDDLLVISDDPKDLLDKLCSKWKEANGRLASATIADEAV